ncbi:hypothetical protein ACWEQ4_00990 [Rhodococcus sp. NPDC003994]
MTATLMNLPDEVTADRFPIHHYGVPLIVTDTCRLIALGHWKDHRRVRAAMSAALRWNAHMNPDYIGFTSTSTLTREWAYFAQELGARKMDPLHVTITDDPWATAVTTWTPA